MDAKLRELERQAAQDDPAAAYRAFIEHRRIGTPAASVPTNVLYEGTKAELKNQAPLDFRTLLVTHTFANYSMGDLAACFRMFKAIQFQGNIFISIQASHFHYCSPRHTMLDVNGYTTWEISFHRPMYIEQVAISPDENKDIVITDEKFALGGILFDFPHQEVFSHYDSVAGWVQTEKIQDMIDFLRARFGLLQPLCYN